jgi:hypothetical protein
VAVSGGATPNEIIPEDMAAALLTTVGKKLIALKKKNYLKFSKSRFLERLFIGCCTK